MGQQRESGRESGSGRAPLLPSPGVRFGPDFLARVGRLTAHLASLRERREGEGSARLFGVGAEFVGYRPYRSGEDLRRLDWNLLARLGRPYVRVAAREASERWAVLLDTSASMGVGTPGKLQLAAELASALAALALARRATIELVLSSGAPGFVARRRGALAGWMGVLAGVRASGTAGLGTLARAAGRRVEAGRVFLIGDLLDCEPRDVLTLARPSRELFLARILAREELVPAQQPVRWVDAETGAQRELVVAGAEARDYEERLAARLELWRGAAARARAVHGVWTSATPFELLVRELFAVGGARQRAASTERTNTRARRRMKGWRMKKLAVLFIALLVFTLLGEGVLSFFYGTSLRSLGRPRSSLARFLQADPEPRDAPADAARLAAALDTAGPYRVPADPLVCNTFKADAEVELEGLRFHTDELGLRARVGPPSGPGAFRLLVLGDALAFGEGLPAEQNLGAQIEALLRAVRAPDAREIACSTVAVPGWNYRNAIRHLLDHLDRFAPDLVLFVPGEDELEDGYGVDEAGQRRRGEDPGAPFPLCAAAAPRALIAALAQAQSDGRARGASELADWAMIGALGPSARARQEDMSASVFLLAERLERVGARLVLAPATDHALARALRARLHERGLELPVLPLLATFAPADGEGAPLRPSAETTRVLATWAVQSLLAQELVPGRALRALPDVPARFAGRRAHALASDELARWWLDFEQACTAGLERRIEPSALRGLAQLYGGLHPDATFGPQCMAVLPPGRALRVTLASVLAEQDAYPLVVEVSVDGRALGRVELAGPGQAPCVGEFSLARGAAPFEVLLAAEDWGLAPVGELRSPVAARLIALESVGD